MEIHTNSRGHFREVTLKEFQSFFPAPFRCRKPHFPHLSTFRLKPSTAWWFSHPSEKYELPSIGMMTATQYEWENVKFTTNQSPPTSPHLSVLKAPAGTRFIRIWVGSRWIPPRFPASKPRRALWFTTNKSWSWMMWAPGLNCDFTIE